MTAPRRGAKAQAASAAASPSAAQAAEPAVWEVIPSPSDAQRIAQRCRRKVTQRALVAAGVAMVPVPGLDLLTDVGLLMKLLPEINEAFGLTPEQVERLAPDRRIVVYKALSAGSSMSSRTATSALRVVPVQVGLIAPSATPSRPSSVKSRSSINSQL
jgi:hypothetical protein